MRRRLGAAALCVTVVTGLVPTAAHGATDPRQRRRELQEKRAKQAAKISVLKASDADLEKALDHLDENVRARQAQASAARQAASAASQAATAARQTEVRTAARLDALRRSMRQVAVETYIRGPVHETVLPFEAKSLSEVANRRYMVDLALGQSTDLADELRATGEDLAAATAAADQAAQEASTRRKEADARLTDVRHARDLKQKVADGVEERLEQALAEADSLAALDRQLATEIAQQQARLAARVGSTARSGRAAGPIGSIATTTVRGITVASSIADQVEGLLSAAAADGFDLGGAGYRDSGGQIAVRESNCGTSQYDIYVKPASSCHPPTARPGQSMHERGLAIDFTWNGAIIGSHNAAFQWLAHNASRYGLYNLAREPWHWSTNGN